MNKNDLINRIAVVAELSQTQASDALNAFLDITTQSLQYGGSVSLVGFGAFKVSHRSQREGRNPQNGLPITIKPLNVVSFKVGSKLKKACNP
jgi:nucleoid DNA-binding protein